MDTQLPENSVYKQEKMDTDADTDSEITPSVEVNQKTVHTFMEQFFIHAFFDIFKLFSTNNNTFHYDSIFILVLLIQFSGTLILIFRLYSS